MYQHYSLRVVQCTNNNYVPTLLTESKYFDNIKCHKFTCTCISFHGNSDISYKRNMRVLQRPIQKVPTVILKHEHVVRSECVQIFTRHSNPVMSSKQTKG